MLSSRLAPVFALLVTAMFWQAAWVLPSEAAEDSFSIGLQYFNRHDYVEALKLFNQRCYSGDKEAQRLYYCALCYLETSQSEQAQNTLKTICLVFPNSQAARLSRTYLKASSVAETKRITQKLPQIASSRKLSSFRSSSNGGIVVSTSGIGGPQGLSGTTGAIASGTTDFDEIAIPFTRTPQGQLTVSAELNGRSMNMIFDTGAEVCLFGSNQIASADLSNVSHSGSQSISTASGLASIHQIIADIQLGSLKRSLPICVQDRTMETAILGQPFLDGYNCEVDNPSGLIRLRRKGQTGTSITLDSFAVPFKYEGDKMIVSAQINGRQTDMCFDTGSFGVCLTKGQAGDLRVTLPDTISEHTHGANGSRVPSWDARADITLGPIQKRAFPVRVIEANFSHPLLGESFFGHRKYTIDTDKREIRFSR